MLPPFDSPKCAKSWSNAPPHNNTFTPRPHQIELLECAAQQNTIICLSGEFGKRFMYTMFIREMIIKSDGQYAQKCAVLLLKDDSVVIEHSVLLQSHLDLEVLACTHDVSENLSCDDLKDKMNAYQVVVCTPNTFLDLLNSNQYMAESMDLIVFDDCHLVNDEMHPSRKIMEILDDKNLSPNIFGLTSSLLYDNISADELKQTISSMENIMHCKAQTATDLVAVDRHTISPPVENIILSSDDNKDQMNSQLIADVRDILKGALRWLHSCQITSASNTKTCEWQVADELQSPGIDHCDSQRNETTTETNHIENTNFVTEDTSPLEVIGNGNCTDTASKVKSIHDNCTMDGQSSDVCKIAIQLLEKSLLVVNVLGPWCVYRLIPLVLKQLQKTLHTATVHAKSAARSNPNEELTSGSEMWQVIMLQYVQTKLRMVYTICNWYMGDHKSVDLAYVSPKVHRLLEVLKEYKPLSDGNDKQSSSHKYNDRNESNYVSWWQDSDAEDEEDFMEESKKGDAQEENQPSLFINTLCGIVFIRDRYVAMMLQKLIRDLSKEDKDLKHVSCSHLTPGGEGGKQDIDPTSMDQSKQEEVLRKFRSHEINLLICTGELEDCAYMPKCNLVVRFDVPKSYRSYAESKSRARAQTSAYVMLVREAEKSEFMEKLQEYKKIEQVLLGQDWQKDADMYSSDDETGDTLCPPLMLTRNQCVTMGNAVNIVNRYCNRLPSDPFTHLTPRYELMELPYNGDSPMFTCVLQLPINSHVREPIQGAPMPSVLLAQQAVAMETCKILYHSGELDENLMPIGKETVKYAEELDPWKREISSISGRPGSTKKRQTYNKDSPSILRSCLPQPESNLFMYEVRMRIRVPLLDELNVRRRRLFFPEDTTRCFGILTTKLLPQIPGFPIFTRSGEESCQLKFCRGFIQLSPQQVKLVRIFHRYVFSDMLRVDRVPLSFQPEQSSSQLLVVVLNKVPTSRAYSSKHNSLDIDWSFMMRTESKRRVIEKIKSDPWYKHRMSEINKVFVFNRELYEDGVVVAKYRSCDQPNRFYVAELKDDMTPQSSFPSSEYQSFQHYYKVKYGLDIRCLKQPLLDVDHTSSRLNLLTPRHLNQKGKALPMSSLEKKRAKYESLHNRQILVPELCEVHPIPASLWRKAVCLPSVLYRVSQLLIAEELRQDIAVKSGITMETPPLGHIWSNLHFGWSDNSSEEDSQENPNQLDDQSGGETELKDGNKPDIPLEDKINEKNQLDNQSTSRDETDLKYGKKPDIPSEGNTDEKDTKHDCNGTVDTEHPFSDGGDNIDRLEDKINEENTKHDCNGTIETEQPFSDNEGAISAGNDVETAQARGDGHCGTGVKDPIQNTTISGNPDKTAAEKTLDTQDSAEIKDKVQIMTIVENQPQAAENGKYARAVIENHASQNKFPGNDKETAYKTNDEQVRFVAKETLNAGGDTNTREKQNEKKICFSDQEQNNDTAELVCDVPAAATLQNQSYVSKEASERLKTPDKVTDTVISSVQNSDEVQNQNQNNISENVGAELTSQASSEDMSDKDVSLSSSDDDSFFSDDHEAHFELSDSEDLAAKREVQKCMRKKRPRKKSKELETVIEIPRTVLDEFVENYQSENLFIGPGPGLILQALTLSNASDGFNLERLEMLGDSFLKHAVTVYLYCTYPEAHEGKLSYMRSKKVSNYNLYRIGKQFGLAGKMTGLIFDPTVNWLPTGFVVGASGQGDDSDEDLSDDDVEIGVWTGIPSSKKEDQKKKQKPVQDLPATSTSNPTSVVTEEDEIYEEDEIQMIDGMLGGCIRNLGSSPKGDNGRIGFDIGQALSGHQSMHFTDKAALRRSQLNKQSLDDFVIDTWAPVDWSGKPLNNSDPLMLDLHTQHSLADKSIADCVEAILGAYLTTCGHRSAQLLLCHLGLNVLPKTPNSDDASTKTTERFGFLIPPPNKMLDCRPNQQVKLDQLLVSLSGFERKINYKFKNKAYLLQAFTHASYYYNTVTDCYQRLEFLGDAVLDFLITRHLFNDERQHSPGALTDLRSALVNNTIFASLAVHYDFHKYFKSISPELHRIVEDFVMYQHKQEDAQGMDAHLMRDYDRVETVAPAVLEQDEEEDETEDVEVPKALGDIFESVAGAIYMDSGMDLSAVWGVYSLMMLPLIERFSSCVPRSPVRELLEMEPETAKFSCAEKRYDGKVRVTVEIIGKGRFKGVGRSYRIAKSAAARRALRFLKGTFLY